MTVKPVKPFLKNLTYTPRILWFFVSLGGEEPIFCA